MMAAYVDGAQKRIARWVDVHGLEQANAIDFVLEPNAFDGFRRFAAGWPNRNAKDSMNERVLASFLNLRGWQVLTGAFLFGKDSLVATGQVELNSKEHTSFQSSFYKAEQAPRQRWLDPFLGMVPESACAAAALRMPAGEFLHAMFDALEEDEKTLIDDAMRRVTFQGTQLTDMRDLINRLQLALLPRTGFVFRKNEPDMSRDESGKLMVPVTAKSPVPQVAWVFWLQPRAQPLMEELVKMLSNNYQTFRFQNVWHLPVKFGNQRLQEPVTEFTQPLIPGTGELAMIVFNDFFVLSNSGPLVRDILRTKYFPGDRRPVAARLRRVEGVRRRSGPQRTGQLAERPGLGRRPEGAAAARRLHRLRRVVERAGRPGVDDGEPAGGGGDGAAHPVRPLRQQGEHAADDDRARW